ncbi:MAG: hypothetical protein IJR49_03780, partial [Treponema sp.]|nr:hypothetical protein [Treponema sp.]
NKDDNTDDKKITSEKKSFILQNENDFHFQIPLDVFLRNISIRYQKKDLVATYTIKRASLLNTSSKNVKSLKVDSNIAVQQKKATLASGKISLNGTLNENLEKSSVLLQFSNFLAYDVQFGRMQFLCSYNDGNALLKSIAHSYPILLDAKYNIRNSIISVDFKSENFVLSSFASSRKRRELLRKVGGTSLSLNSRVEYNILEKSLLYDSHGAIYLPNTLVPSGVNVVHTLSGNQDAIEFTRLNLQGSSYDATSYIRYAFKNKNLFGSVNLNRITLPNGTDLSGELFLDSFSDSFVCFAPEIILGQKVLTALELSVFPSPSSIDVHFELSDYSHPEAENVGSASLDLTYLLKQKYAQISLDISDFFLDAVAEISSAFLSENISKNVSSFASSLSPYMIASELYASTDFKSVSYNVPFLLAANTQKDNQFLLASISGNENNFQIPRMNIIFGANNANINFSLNKEPASDSSFFTLDVNTKTVPYHFIGNIVDRSVSVSGDYGFTLQANANQQGELTGSFSIENFPFEIGKGIMWLSSNAGFAYTEKDGFALSLARFEAEDKGDAFS